MKNPVSLSSCDYGLDEGWRQVHNFHLACNQPIGTRPAALSPIRTNQWASWITEEIDEFSKSKGIADQADALMDVIYFALGAFVEMGVPPQRIFEFVHAANLAKAWPSGEMRCAVDGKVIKPPNWIAPQPAIRTFIEALAKQALTPKPD